MNRLIEKVLGEIVPVTTKNAMVTWGSEKVVRNLERNVL
jgi:hypothetical protein